MIIKVGHIPIVVDLVVHCGGKEISTCLIMASKNAT